MKANKAITVILIILVLGIIVYLFSRFFMGNFLLNKNPTVTINSHQFKLLITKTTLDKQIGLSKYKSLPQDQGMLFSFGKADYYLFWMKEMKFPIDIIYIKNDKIVSIFQNVQPPKSPNTTNIPVYRPTDSSDTVLEINAGLSKKYNIKNGDSVKYENFSG